MVAASTSSLVPARRGKVIPTLTGGLPLLGHLPQLQNDFLGLIDRARDEGGDIVLVNAGPKKIAVVSEPAMTEHILVDNVRNYTKQTKGYNALRKALGNGLVTSEGSFWLRQRRIAQPAFHREKLGVLSSTMLRDTDELLASWASGGKLQSGEAFDFAEEMMKLTMRIIGEALFSVDVSGETDEAGQAFTELVHQAAERTFTLFDFPDIVPTPFNRRFSHARAVLDKLVYGVIEERRRGEAKPDLLSMLMDAVDEETGEKMNDEQLRDEVITLFGAGHETTSTALTWTLFELMQNPGVEAKLRAEIDAHARDGAPLSMEQLMRMPYLDAVLKESMRVHPPIFLVARQCESDDVVGGYALPKGHLVMVSQWLMHRHPKYWREPLRFDPARFIDAGEQSRPKYTYFPFLGGPRKCIGDQLSILEAKIILARLLQKARFTLVPGHEVVPDPTVSLRMLNGLRVTARSQ